MSVDTTRIAWVLYIFIFYEISKQFVVYVQCNLSNNKTLATKDIHRYKNTDSALKHN